MHQTKKGDEWYFGMKAHIGVDAKTGMVHRVMTTAADVNDLTEAHRLLHGVKGGEKLGQQTSYADDATEAYEVSTLVDSAANDGPGGDCPHCVTSGDGAMIELAILVGIDHTFERTITLNTVQGYSRWL